MNESIISKRTFNNGIAGSALIAVLHMLYAFYEYSGFDFEIKPFSSYVYALTYIYFYMSILFSFKKILIDYYEQLFLRKKLYSIIILSFIIAILTLLIIFQLVEYLVLPTLILGVITFVVWMMFFSDIGYINKLEIRTIAYLKNAILAVFIVLFLILALEVLIRLGIIPDLFYLKRVLLAIPFIFLVIFFYRTKKEVYRNVEK